MTNRSRRKGTDGENDVKQLLEEITGRPFRRTSAGCRWDLETADGIGRDGEPIHILATRPDRGQWLCLMSPHDWFADPSAEEIRVEVKRKKTYSHHSLFNGKVKGGATTQPEP